MRRRAVLAAAAALTCGAGAAVAVASAASGPPGSKVSLTAAGPVWRNVATRALAYNGGLDKVDVVNKQTAWAVGRTKNGQTRILRWHGRGWVQQASPVNFVPTDVAGAGPRNAWAIGFGPGLGITAVHWNGAKWAKVGYPLVGVPNQVSAAPDGAAWSVASIASSGGGVSSVLRWNGRAFVKVNVPLPPSTSITAVDVRSKRDVWLAGTTTTDGRQVTGLVLHFDGTRWKRLPLPGGMGTPGFQGVLHKIVALSPTNVYVSRVAQQAQIPNALMQWNGSRWRTIPTPLAAAGIGLAGDGAGGAWVTTVAQDRRTLYLHWNRTSWSTMRGPQRPGGIALGDIDLIPGTRSVFSVGSYPGGNNRSVPVIERFV